MGLKRQHNAVIPHGPDGGNGGVEFPGMMGIIVIHVCAAVIALEFQAAASPPEGLQTPGHCIAGNPQAPCHGGGSQGVGCIVAAKDVELDAAVKAAIADDLKVPPVLGISPTVDLIVL